MNNRQIELIIGSLLHDVGKILYRHNDGRNHSTSGCDFLKEQGIDNNNILDQVKYHHAKHLSGASLEKDSLAYVAYWADNVSAAADRRSDEDTSEYGYDKFVPLSSVFNILNNNNQNFSYPMELIYDSGKPNVPDDTDKQYSSEVYGKIIQTLRDNLNSLELSQEYINSLLSVLEGTLSFVPSSTQKAEFCDVSLYDHCKITAAVASCLYEYLEENNISDYHMQLFKEGSKLYSEGVFLLLSMDISGIQDFIYTISDAGALKTLRAKSFYLEIMLEHIVDELLTELDLSRANLIYSGGGHAYLIVSNTDKTKNVLEDFIKRIKKWFLNHFRSKLYIAFGYEKCSADTLCDKSAGSYKELFRSVGRKVSKDKLKRYGTEEIRYLNSFTPEQYTRECRICGSLNHLSEDNLCPMCSSFDLMSKGILEKDFVTVLTEKPAEPAAVLPFDRYMILESEEELKKRIIAGDNYLRSYSKNKLFTGYNLSTKIWTGDYHLGSSFQEMAEAAKGIKRIGVLRADVDNLGQAFVAGFERSDGKTYTGLSRSATFSRKMSIFFKLHLNYILEHGHYSLEDCGDRERARHAMIVYAGGDDVFLIGAWNEIIEAAVDINNELKKFTQNTLHISAGIGIFPEKFPVRALAEQTGDLEDAAKQFPPEATPDNRKNSVALFSEENTYKWDVFSECVIGEKLSLIRRYFDAYPEKGMAMIYKLLSYLRNRDEKINIARFAYLLGRVEPGKDADEEKRSLYKELSQKLYQWIKNDKDCRELITAIYIYVYLNRTKEETDGSIN